MLKRKKRIIKKFFINVKTEANETMIASKLIKKQLKGNKLTIEESKQIRKQLYDLLRSAGIVIPFILIPGGSLIVPIMLKLSKKVGVEILPSSFRG